MSDNQLRRVDIAESNRWSGNPELNRLRCEPKDRRSSTGQGIPSREDIISPVSPMPAVRFSHPASGFLPGTSHPVVGRTRTLARQNTAYRDTGGPVLPKPDPRPTITRHPSKTRSPRTSAPRNPLLPDQFPRNCATESLPSSNRDETLATGRNRRICNTNRISETLLESIIYSHIIVHSTGRGSRGPTHCRASAHCPLPDDRADSRRFKKDQQEVA